MFFDSKLTFQSYIDIIYKKAAHKLNVISRIAPYMDFNKRKLAVNTFFSSQFNYCLLIWMCYDSTYNNKINRLHERCLRLIYINKGSSFEELLVKDNLSLYTIKTFILKFLQILCKKSFRSRALFSKKSKRFCDSDRYIGKLWLEKH